VKIIFNKKKMGAVFKKDAKVIYDHFDDITEEDKQKLMAELNGDAAKIVFERDGKSFEMDKETITMENSQIKIHEEKYTPSVIEPAFGIGRIIYCIFEHCFKCREHDAQWTYF
jgi:glycyl-tRNA synthetase